MSYVKTDRIEEFQAELNKLKEGCTLLEEIWNWCGPYGLLKEPIPEELLIQLQRYFDFDDSE